MATKLNLEDGEVQVSTLLYALGKEAEQVFNTFVFAEDEDAEDYETVLEKLNIYFIPKVNVIHERARFYLREQKHSELAEEYIRTLYEPDETCQFGPPKIENIQDRLVIGIVNKELSEKLQLTADLTLERTVETVRQSEQTKGQISQQARASLTDASYLSEVARTHARAVPTPQCRGRKKKHVSFHTASLGHRSDGGKCFRCGKDHPKHTACAARNAQCRNCHKTGQFAVVCRSARVNEVTTVGQEADHSGRQFLGEIKTKYTYIAHTMDC